MSAVRFSPKIISIAIFLVVSFHYIFTFSSNTYAEKTSYASLKSTISNTYKNSQYSNSNSNSLEELSGGKKEENHKVNEHVVEVAKPRRANAAFVVLARNSDIWEILASIRAMEGK